MCFVNTKVLHIMKSVSPIQVWEKRKDVATWVNVIARMNQDAEHLCLFSAQA